MFRLTCALIVTFLVGCGGDDDVGNNGGLVGGSCRDSGDCEFRCQTGDDYPGGTCTVACNLDDDCPEGSYCINKEGGICLLGCQVPGDCRGGYNCEGQENRTHGGDSLVCIN